MIYYFSGTGNTRYAARTISNRISEKLCFIPDENADKQAFEGNSLGFMFPVYSWGVPPLVLELIESLPEEYVKTVRERNIPLWMVCTCGDETGRTPEMLEKALARRGLELKGKWSVIMPDCYVLLPGFDVDSPDEEREKLDACQSAIKIIGEKIAKGEWESDIHYGSLPGLKTSLVYPLFKKWGIIRKKWHWSEACISCGKCAAKCPVCNIDMKDGHPAWGDRCVSCLACYHNCPVHAVEYGKITAHKGQYLCPLQ